MQYVHYLQRRYSLGSFNLLGHTAPAQAVSLLLVGPFLDYWLTDKRVDAYAYNFTSVVSFCINCMNLTFKAEWHTLLQRQSHRFVAFHAMLLLLLLECVLILFKLASETWP